MIKTYQTLPHVYYDESRDFQLLGRLLDVINNYCKTASDSLQNLSLNRNTDKTLVELICRTVGFMPKHEYNQEDLFALCSVFKSIIKYKGTKKAIEDVVKTLLYTQNIDVESFVELNTSTCEATISIPIAMEDVILLEDMMDYILPAGWIYKIININKVISTSDSSRFNDSPNDESKSDESLGIVGEEIWKSTVYNP